MHASAIFQRTESGRSEIKNKMHGLTQSERLALIVIDGVSTYGDLRKKLNGLTEERFERALLKLLQKNLIFEVLLPTEDGIEEEFDSKTVDQFLFQDPLDPVTIMSIDPEEEFDLDMPAETSSPSQFQSLPLKAVAAKSTIETNRPISAEKIAADKAAAILPNKKPLKIASVDFYVPLEKPDQIASDSVSVPGAKTISAGSSNAVGRVADTRNSKVVFSEAPARRFAWAPILMIGGLIIIMVSLVLTFRH